MVSSTHVILVPLSSSGLSIVRVELMMELVTEVNVNMSVELQSLLLLVVPTGLSVLKLLEVVPHFDTIVQPMTVPPLLVHWYEATSLEHTGPGPTSCVD